MGHVEADGTDRVRVLLVEDDVQDAEMVSAMLRRAGGATFLLDQARSLADASAVLEKCSYDVLLLDLGLPDATGLDIVTRLRTRAPTTPILVLTGNADERVAVRAVGANAQDYLVKWDFNEHVLVRSIRQAMEREVLEQGLRHAKAEAERANLGKSRFLAVMSHEIRTPMNTVLGMADLLAGEGELSERQRERLDRLCRAGNHLLRLIDDLLDLSRIEAGHLELEHVPFDLNQLLSRTLELLQPSAACKGVGLTWRTAPGVPTSLIGDPHRVQQILLNLVGNALKFTPAGRVEVRVERDAASDAAGALRFAVSDTGIGIPPERLPHVFSSFVQADASTSRKYGGAGLGLSIAKGLAEAMGGSISAQSSVGEGSVFVVSLTLDVDAHAAVPVDEVPPRLAPPEHLVNALSLRARRTRVLLVDDSVDNHALVEGYLAGIATVEHASTAARAFIELAAQPFDVILMDMHLPFMSGFEATKAIRAAEQATGSRSVPILAVTADALKSSVDRAMQAGCTAYLVKPLRREALLRAIGEHVRDEPPSRAGPPSVLFGPDRGVESLLPRFLVRRQEDVRTMRAAMGAGDFARVFTLGHNMKGTGGAYGLPMIGELGGRLEEAAGRRDAKAVHLALDELEERVDRLVEERGKEANPVDPNDARASGLYRCAHASGDDAESGEPS